jgi:hypothetical protein
MKINMEALTSLTQFGLLGAVSPCHVTQNFFKLVITAHEELSKHPAGELVDDEATGLKWLNDVAEQAVATIPAHHLARELDSLNASDLRHDMRPTMSFHLVAYKPLSVPDNLRLTVQAVYVAMLHKLLFSLGR